MTQREVQHLYLRAGFGASIETIRESTGMGQRKVVDVLFADSANPTMLDAVSIPASDDMQMVSRKDLNADERKKMREYRNEQDKKLNLAWLKKIMSGHEALNEKMTFFWHDHFACKDDNPLDAQYLNNTIRKYALGDFRQLLLAVSQEPAMLRYLNNQQNKKNAPNENFAREVLELFTLGRDHYTEDDIKNAARAFTGWGFDKETHGFQFHDKQHDYGEKKFLGVSGTLTGEDVLRIVTGQRQCAYYITDKLYRYFVNERGNESRISKLADDFYANGYDIASLMKSIFSSGWFYDEENIACRIKSPIELIASLGLQLQPVFAGDNILMLMQRVLGQVLFSPPNVAGWPNGTEWIDSSSLIFRTSLGTKMIGSEEIHTVPKPDDDKVPNEMPKRERKFTQIDAQIDWTAMLRNFDATGDSALIDQATAFLLQTNTTKIPDIRPEGLTDEQKVKRICAVITSLPEYQLC
jgi:uncharacterized protein (DUF1800 family)